MSEETHTHVHVLEDGTVIEHSHDHAHGHHHTNTKAVLNRLSRSDRTHGVDQADGRGRPGLH